jgi:transcriptional regulator with XRE-family HTH domain
LEKSFLSLKHPGAKEAYVEAELVNGLAHQIRILREQRGWTQKQLAKYLDTTQNTISRLEDPSYGRYTFRTLLGLSKAFGVALFVRYLPFSKFIQETWNTSPELFEAASYDEEVASIQFFTEGETRGNMADLYERIPEHGSEYNETYLVPFSSHQNCLSLITPELQQEIT